MKPSEGMFVPTGRKRFTGSLWYYQIIKMDDDGITVQLYDAAYAKPVRLSYFDLDSLILRYGLWKKTGLYQFDKANNPAIKHIISATQSSQWAGQRIYDLEQKVEMLKKQIVID